MSERDDRSAKQPTNAPEENETDQAEIDHGLLLQRGPPARARSLGGGCSGVWKLSSDGDGGGGQ